MLRHIVLWKMKESVTKKKEMHQIKSLLEALKEKVPEIVELEVGIDITHDDASADIVLNSLFKNKEDLIQYQQHPEHVEVVKGLRVLTTEKRVVDYEI
jgi:type II secretory pathway component PulM